MVLSNLLFQGIELILDDLNGGIEDGRDPYPEFPQPEPIPM